jgi:hypothetical protein
VPGELQPNLRLTEVTEIKTVPYVPLSHPFVERLINHWTRIFESPIVLDDCRPRKQAVRTPGLLQQPSHPYPTGRANARYARVATNRKSRLVSMAISLSSPISDIYQTSVACLTFQRLRARGGNPVKVGKNSEFTRDTGFASSAHEIAPSSARGQVREHTPAEGHNISR